MPESKKEYKKKARRTFGVFDPIVNGSKTPFRVSRSKLDSFVKCPLCFYLDLRCGVGQPSTYPLTLNIAVDELLKKEFDIHRAAGTKHPFMESYGIDAVPFDHPDMEKWRDALKRGIEYVHPPTNFSVRGGVDDVWINPKGELIIVDYKATSKRDEITLDGSLGDQYKRQMAVYQWLFAMNGFSVSPTGYFVYVNGNKDAEAFDKKLEFDVVILPCKGDTSWIEDTLIQMKTALMSDSFPNPHPNCEFCAYRKAARDVQEERRKVTQKLT